MNTTFALIAFLSLNSIPLQTNAYLLRSTKLLTQIATLIQLKTNFMMLPRKPAQPVIPAAPLVLEINMPVPGVQ
jgi:hypothetical protein